MVGASYISELERPSSMKQKEVGQAWQVSNLSQQSTSRVWSWHQAMVGSSMETGDMGVTTGLRHLLS